MASKNNIIVSVVLILAFIFSMCMYINFLGNNKFIQSEEDLIDMFNGFYELDLDFKELADADNSSLIIRNDTCEFITENNDSINISLDYKDIHFDKKKINIIATVFTTSDSIEENPLINTCLKIVLNLKNGILQISNLDSQTIMGIYTKDNIITNLM